MWDFHHPTMGSSERANGAVEWAGRGDFKNRIALEEIGWPQLKPTAQRWH